MAGSRLERLGSIFSRISGLIRSGAMKKVDRPLWFDVYAAFPPKYVPKYERVVPKIKVKEIFYQEDILRARFYNEYGSPGLTNMVNDSNLSLQDQFLGKCKLYEQSNMNVDEIFSTAINDLLKDGFKLKSLSDITTEESEKLKQIIKQKKVTEKK